MQNSQWLEKLRKKKRVKSHLYSHWSELPNSPGFPKWDQKLEPTWVDILKDDESFNEEAYFDENWLDNKHRAHGSVSTMWIAGFFRGRWDHGSFF